MPFWAAECQNRRHITFFIETFVAATTQRGQRNSTVSMEPNLNFSARSHAVLMLTIERQTMNVVKTIARKADSAWEGTKSYFGFGIDSSGTLDDDHAHQAASDAGQARTKIKAVFDR